MRWALAEDRTGLVFVKDLAGLRGRGEGTGLAHTVAP